MRLTQRSTRRGLQALLAASALIHVSAFTNATSAQQRAPAATKQGSSDARAAEAESGGDEVDLSPKAAAASAPVAKVKKPRVATKAKPGTTPAAAVKQRVKAGRQPTPEYVKMRDSWHAPIEPQLTPTPKVTGRVPLVLSRVLNGGDSVTLVPQREDGGFSDDDLQRAARGAFCPIEAKKIHPISPRLLDLVYRAMRHFNAPLVHVVSGYRPDRAGSRHTQGRAIDMVLPGVTNEELADYVRTYGFVGVGIYPKSGFVHLDVRDTSYFWVDDSLPDERSRGVPILTTLAAQADRVAAARGDAPDTWVPDNDKDDRAAAKSYARRAKSRRDRALRQQSAAATSPSAVHDDPAPKDKPAAQAKPATFSVAGVLD
jgi:hypothetical protein